ncbi:PR domain zinc finger protein 5-like isoform X2 [Battus philenor]|uniref:PR domain zinc finger protein 5-like isoform X2 n=1 Tax=Battus philenor TaxID=42288 RepID=UPI0035CED51F
MATKTTEWRPGPTVCRCCLAEGCYKDISTEYFWMGKREVYAEMLANTFDLSIAYSQSGGPYSNSRLICEPCISRLRDAADFKRQVVECEKTFLQHLDPSCSADTVVNVSAVVPLEDDREVKIEGVKVERLGSEDELDDSANFNNDDDDDDDLDDQPLTKLASKCSKKDSVDLLDIIDNAKVADKRKSTVKVKATPVKKVKMKKEAKATASKAKPEKKKKGSTLELRRSGTQSKSNVVLVYQSPQRRNAELILKHSTAYPFKTRFSRILCAYCHTEYEYLTELKYHMECDHPNPDFKNVFYRMKGNLIKIDISNLKCKICCKSFPNVVNLMRHFSQEHDLPVKLNSCNGVIPFKFSEKKWICVACDKSYSAFVDLKRHVITHFMKYNCDKCGTTFITRHALRDHQRQVKCYRIAYKPRNGRVMRPRSNAEIILQCSSAYPFRTWMSNLNCVFCRVKTRDPIVFRSHMASHHASYDVQSAFYKKLGKAFLNVDITDLRCKLCFTAIDNFEDLIDHLKNIHRQPIRSDAQFGLLPFKLNDGSTWNCAICSNQFKNFSSLKKHTHSHFQNYVCDTCGEGFITESAMISHTKIPHENKYNCSRCVATFSSLQERNAHVKTQHTSTPYLCGYCKDKPRFATWEIRKKHLLEVHNYGTGEDNYECTLCQKTFKSRSGKYNHMSRVHRIIRESELSFTCACCSRAFTSQLFLDKHIAKKHGDL